MLYTVPDYYTEFSCIAGDCPDTCCAGWQIVIDEKSQEKYKQYKGDFGKRLKSSVDWKEGVFRQNGKRCAFLNDENLCDIYKNAGPDMLCDTCRRYPRHVEEYEDLREISLSLSCPVVAEMLISKTDPVRFITKERPMAAEEYEEFDYMLFTKLCDARDLMIIVLQNRSVDVRLRMAMVLALGHDFQRRVSNGQLFEVDELLDRYGAEDAMERFEKRCEPYTRALAEENDEVWRALSGLFDELEVLKHDFPEYRRARLGHMFDHVFERAHDHGGEDGNKEGISGLADAVSDRESVWIEQLMVYFIYTYFCGAVYDEQAYGKVKFAVASTLLIRGLYLGDDRCEGAPDRQAAVEAAYRYAKEVEHSDPNLLRMEEILLRRREFSLENLLKLLLCG